MRLIYTTAYGLEYGKQFYYYKKGTSLQDLPELVVSFEKNNHYPNQSELLSKKVIYSEKDHGVFFGD